MTLTSAAPHENGLDYYDELWLPAESSPGPSKPPRTTEIPSRAWRTCPEAPTPVEPVSFLVFSLLGPLSLLKNF